MDRDKWRISSGKVANEVRMINSRSADPLKDDSYRHWTYLEPLPHSSVNCPEHHRHFHRIRPQDPGATGLPSSPSVVGVNWINDNNVPDRGESTDGYVGEGDTSSSETLDLVRPLSGRKFPVRALRPHHTATTPAPQRFPVRRRTTAFDKVLKKPPRRKSSMPAIRIDEERSGRTTSIADPTDVVSEESTLAPGTSKPPLFGDVDIEQYGGVMRILPSIENDWVPLP